MKTTSLNVMNANITYLVQEREKKKRIQERSILCNLFIGMKVLELNVEILNALSQSNTMMSVAYNSYCTLLLISLLLKQCPVGLKIYFLKNLHENLGIVSRNHDKYKLADNPLKRMLTLVHAFQWDIGELVLTTVS